MMQTIKILTWQKRFLLLAAMSLTLAACAAPAPSPTPTAVATPIPDVQFLPTLTATATLEPTATPEPKAGDIAKTLSLPETGKYRIESGVLYDERNIDWAKYDKEKGVWTSNFTVIDQFYDQGKAWTREIIQPMTGTSIPDEEMKEGSLNYSISKEVFPVKFMTLNNAYTEDVKFKQIATETGWDFIQTRMTFKVKINGMVKRVTFTYNGFLKLDDDVVKQRGELCIPNINTLKPGLTRADVEALILARGLNPIYFVGFGYTPYQDWQVRSDLQNPNLMEIEFSPEKVVISTLLCD
jgi:hypothetical protein